LRSDLRLKLARCLGQQNGIVAGHVGVVEGRQRRPDQHILLTVGRALDGMSRRERHCGYDKQCNEYAYQTIFQNEGRPTSGQQTSISWPAPSPFRNGLRQADSRPAGKRKVGALGRPQPAAGLFKTISDLSAAAGEQRQSTIHSSQDGGLCRRRPPGRPGSAKALRRPLPDDVLKIVM